MTRPFLLLSMLVLLAVAACSSEPTPTAVPGPPPTTNPFFGGSVEPTPLGGTASPLETSLADTLETDQAGQTPSATGTVAVTATPESTPFPTPTPTVTPSRLITYTVFDDRLNENWHLENTHWMTVTRQTRVHHNGHAALEFIPYEDFGSLFFSVSEDATMEYPRPQVAGLIFWLNGGEDPIRPQDLAVTIVGSNEYTYWVPGDYSVQSTMQPVFSETRLEFLGLGRDVPPGDWVRIEVRLNELQYDPPYRHVTVFYLKNDRGVLHPFYIDDIMLVMAEAENG